MKNYKTRGIVIRRDNMGETDRRVTYFTKKLGRVTLIAKGARRPKSRLASSTDMFCEIEMVAARGRSLDILTETKIISSHSGISSAWIKTKNAYWVGELINNLVHDEEPNIKLYQLLSKTLKVINDSNSHCCSCVGRSLKTEEIPACAGMTKKGAVTTEKTGFQISKRLTPFASGTTDKNAEMADCNNIIVDYFIFNCLALLGYEPELKKCAASGKQLSPTDKLMFDPVAGGIVCSINGNGKGRPIDVDTIKTLRYFKEPWEKVVKLKIPPATQKNVHVHLKDFAEAVLEREIKSDKLK